MSRTLHASAYLKKPDEHDLPAMVAVPGGSRFLQRSVLDDLRHRVLGDDDDGMGETRFEGRDADLASVLDELSTVSMWGDRRLVVVEDADDFVSRFRGELESYLDSPSRKSVLVLLCKSWNKSTRLHKALAKQGLVLTCDDLQGGQLTSWLTATAKEEYGRQLARDAAALLVEFAGTELGLLDQELAKLAAFVGDRPRIDADDVRAVVGGWRAETTWAMLDAVQDGRGGDALVQLDKLLNANEAPQKILGGLSFVFRRLAKAVQLSARRVPLGESLKQAGIRRPADVDRGERFLRRIGRVRAERFLERLAAADEGMKGGSKLPDRTQLEQLLIVLGGPPAARR